ncbi:carbohydrate ABC transporter permease [Kitasatospora arboriphila]
MSEQLAPAPQSGAEDRVPPVKAVRRVFSSPLASLLMVVVTVLWTIPTIGLLVTSLRPEEDVSDSGWWTVFGDPNLTLENYHTVLFEGGFGVSGGLMPYMVNSLAISIPATVFPLVLAAMAAYGLAWVKFRGSDVVFFAIFALQVVPLQMALIPLLQLFSGGAHIGSVTVIPAFDLSGTYAPVWLAHTMFAMPLAIFLLHNFIAQLPRDLMEAAVVDGATHFKIFRSIVLPLCARRWPPSRSSSSSGSGTTCWWRSPSPRHPRGRPDDRPAGPAERLLRRPLGTAHGRRLPVADHPADRLLRAAAVLRPRPAGGLGQGLSRPLRPRAPAPATPPCPVRGGVARPTPDGP